MVSRAGGHWIIVECTRGRESACVSLLRRLGYSGGWYPVRTINAVSGAKRRALREAGRPAPKQTREVAYVPGYLFIPTSDIACHEVNGTHGKLWLRVLSPGGRPYRVRDEDMAAMEQVPGRVQQIVDEVRQREREAWEAVRPIPGKQACVTRGAFNGMCGVVVDIRHGEVEIDAGGLLGNIKVPEAIAERVA